MEEAKFHKSQLKKRKLLKVQQELQHKSSTMNQKIIKRTIYAKVLIFRKIHQQFTLRDSLEKAKKQVIFFTHSIIHMT
jgi:hypothetical protein